MASQELTRWLRDVLAVLRPQMGAHVRHQPLYPDFPEQVLAASKAQLYLTAVMHYLTLRRLPPQRNARPALLEGEFMHRVIELGSMQEFESLLEPLVSSRTSLSEADTADVVWFIRQYRGDAPQGASEFIDLDIDALVSKGIRYVVTSINSYTEQPYCDLPECFAGWMARADTASGEVFEPRSVVDRIDIASDTQICLPFVMDLQDRRMIWADLGLTAAPRWNNVRNNLSGVSLMMRALLHTPRPDLETLFDLHARARGERVDEAGQAQTVFAPHQGLTPLDVDVIRARFL